MPTTSKWICRTLAVAACLTAAACGDNGSSSGKADTQHLTHCNNPRPEVCTFEYRPVCGLRGRAWKTYGNACSACSDKEVVGYKPGECA